MSFLQDYQGGRDFNSLKKFEQKRTWDRFLDSTRRIEKVRNVWEEHLRPGGAIECIGL